MDPLFENQLLQTRRQFFGRIFAVAVDVEALQCIGGKALVEAPVVTDRGNAPLVVEEHLRRRVDPDMRMRLRERGGEADSGGGKDAKAQRDSPTRLPMRAVRTAAVSGRFQDNSYSGTG